ncbi:PQQ-binding-like beta-propeller repeat protein [Streptomyces sp. NPDC002463]|uniref:outer membrane protein assembly factor BamB family protein n=1 Tax=Streptomyces sp. NPDC002463 TaxID=3364645 RepID=UPI0036BE2427
MNRIRTTVALGLVLSAGLVTGCSGSAEPDAKPSGGETGTVTESASASATPKSAVYQGKPVPGLAAKPAWSLTRDEAGNCAGNASVKDSSQNDICTVGDALVLTTYSNGQAGTNTFTVRLLDAETGKLRKKFDLAIAADDSGSTSSSAVALAQVGEWRDGSPALLIRNRVDTPASGLKKASTQTVLTMYAPSGEKLGSSSFDEDTHMSTPVRNGYLVDASSIGGSATFIPIGGGETVTSDVSAFDLKGTVGSGLGYYSQPDISYQPSADWLTVKDVRTGNKAWNSKDLTPPAAIAKLVTSDKATSARLMPFRGDKALLEWSSYGSSEAVMTLIDVKSGRRLAEGPAIDTNGTTDDDGLAISPDGKTAVVQYGKGAVAWNTETGKELWRQAEDEVTIGPGDLPGNGVLYAYLDGVGAALDADDKKLLASEIAEMPQFTTNGYAAIHTSEGLFVFATQPV